MLWFSIAYLLSWLTVPPCNGALHMDMVWTMQVGQPVRPIEPRCRLHSFKCMVHVSHVYVHRQGFF